MEEKPTTSGVSVVTSPKDPKEISSIQGIPKRNRLRKKKKQRKELEKQRVEQMERGATTSSGVREAAHPEDPETSKSRELQTPSRKRRRKRSTIENEMKKRRRAEREAQRKAEHEAQQKALLEEMENLMPEGKKRKLKQMEEQMQRTKPEEVQRTETEEQKKKQRTEPKYSLEEPTYVTFSEALFPGRLARQERESEEEDSDMDYVGLIETDLEEYEEDDYETAHIASEKEVSETEHIETGKEGRDMVHAESVKDRETVLVESGEDRETVNVASEEEKEISQIRHTHVDSGEEYDDSVYSPTVPHQRATTLSITLQTHIRPEPKGLISNRKKKLPPTGSLQCPATSGYSPVMQSSILNTTPKILTTAKNMTPTTPKDQCPSTSGYYYRTSTSSGKYMISSTASHESSSLSEESSALPESPVPTRKIVPAFAAKKQKSPVMQRPKTTLATNSCSSWDSPLNLQSLMKPRPKATSSSSSEDSSPSILPSVKPRLITTTATSPRSSSDSSTISPRKPKTPMVTAERMLPTTTPYHHISSFEDSPSSQKSPFLARKKEPMKTAEQRKMWSIRETITKIAFQLSPSTSKKASTHHKSEEPTLTAEKRKDLPTTAAAKDQRPSTSAQSSTKRKSLVPDEVPKSPKTKRKRIRHKRLSSKLSLKKRKELTPSTSPARHN